MSQGRSSRLRHLGAVVVLVAGCATEAPIALPPAHAPQPARPALSDDLADAIETGDLDHALSTL